MKKLILASLLLGGFTSFAQTAASPADVVQTKTHISAPPAYNNQLKATPFWSEDFSAGIPAGWNILDTSGICPWSYSTDGSWGNFNGNNATAGAAGIASTSAANGFLICDPDSANHFTYGQPSGTTYQYLSSYIALPSIDCSGRTSVILSFEQFYRYNNGVAMNVKVSNNGTTWTTYNVSNGVANNAASANAALATVNITNVAANQANVYIQIGWSARVYYWMIDDIALSEADANDVMIGDNWWGSGQYGYQYYKLPLNQMTPQSFFSEVSNNTGAALSNVFTEVTVNNPAQVFQGTSAQSNLLAVETDTFMVTTTWTPSVIGSYTVDYTCDLSGATDGNLNNNDAMDSLQITTSLYGLDNLTSPSQSTASISNFSNNTGQPFRIGNLYEIINDDGIQCIEVGVSTTASNAGKSIYAEVHVYDTISDAWEFRGSTDIYDLTATDLGTIISLPLFVEAPVYAGEEALVVAGHYGGATDGSEDVRFMYGQSVPEGMVYGFDAAGDSYYLSNPRAIVVRAQFECGLGLEENNLDQLIVYPNPATNEMNVEFIANSGKVELILVDAQGKEVMQEVYLNAAGAFSASLKTASLAGGVYTLKVINEASSSTQRVVIMK